MDDVTIPWVGKAEEVADIIGVDVSTVHRLARDGGFPPGAVLEWGAPGMRAVRRFRIDIILAGGVVDMEARRRAAEAAAPTSSSSEPRGGATGSTTDLFDELDAI